MIAALWTVGLISTIAISGQNVAVAIGLRERGIARLAALYLLGTGSIACRAMTARALAPANGGVPASISYRTQPTA